MKKTIPIDITQLYRWHERVKAAATDLKKSPASAILAAMVLDDVAAEMAKSVDKHD